MLIAMAVLITFVIFWQGMKPNTWALTDGKAFWAELISPRPNFSVKKAAYPVLASFMAGVMIYAHASSIESELAYFVMLSWSLLFISALHDIQVKMIADRLLLASLIVAVTGYAIYADMESLKWMMLSGVIGYMALWSVYLVGTLISRPLMGLGDVKLVGVLSFLIGIESFGAMLVIASTLALVAFVLLKTKDWTQEMAFGPVLVVGGLLAYHF